MLSWLTTRPDSATSPLSGESWEARMLIAVDWTYLWVLDKIDVLENSGTDSAFYRLGPSNAYSLFWRMPRLTPFTACLMTRCFFLTSLRFL